MKSRNSSAASDLLDERRNSTNSAKNHFDLSAFMPERINVEISKRYDIDAREIGSGGYGKVFVAKDREMKNRRVAIKKVIVFDEDKKKAFKREVLIMKQLDHPNICKLLETYEQGRFMFFVMEYCEGREVFDRIMEHGMIAETTTSDIIRQCASALKHAHSKRIAHRDMKPENICFCNNDVNDNHVKVIDWGLGFYFGQARMISSVGSLTYAAPEVLESRDVDGYTPACDLWSLGVVAYVMLCGKPPFWGNYQEQVKRMKKEAFPMSDSTWQSISSDAKDFIRATLKNDPKDRMQLNKALAHPWLDNPARTNDPKLNMEILSNLKQFSNTSQFFSLCVASVARQLDHRSLRDVHRVFCEMDTDGDGVLSLKEVYAGFEKIYGKGSEQLRDVEAMFNHLDLDGSGTIDYTEFCAAGIGERASTEEDVLWAAFKAFDVEDDDGKISRDEIKRVLLRTGVDQCWTDELCETLSDELFKRYDRNGDGTIDFNEWLQLMRGIARRHRQQTNMPQKKTSSERRLLDELDRAQFETGKGSASFGQFDKAYGILMELEKQEQQSAPPGAVRSAPAALTHPVSPSCRTVSGSLYAMNLMRSHTPTCFTCSPGHKDAKCQIM